jgi:hypothetical protein
MNRFLCFPTVSIFRHGSGFEAVAGIRLKSILMGELLFSPGDFRKEQNTLPNPLDPRLLQSAREALLRAIAGWEPSVTLELHLTALPNIMHKTMGRFLVTLFIRCFAAIQEKAKEDLYRRFLCLIPLLGSHLAEAEFEPVCDFEEFSMRWTPFASGHAVALLRRCEALSLSTPLKRVSVGFVPGTETGGADSEVVQHVFPWTPSHDDWSRLVDTLLGQLDPLRIIVRLRPGADTSTVALRCEETISSCELFLAGVRDYQVTLSRQAGLLRDLTLSRLAGLKNHCFNIGVFLLAACPVDQSLISVVGQAVTGGVSSADSGFPFQGGFSFAQVGADDAGKLDFFAESEPYTPAEAACAFRLPSPPLTDHPGLPVRRSRTALAFLSPESSEVSGKITLAVNEHRGLVHPVCIGTEDRMRHTFIIGQTGTGKSTLMESMILQDIRAGRGVAVIDPHGEMIESILGGIPEERANDVILCDLLDRERPIGFNLLAWTEIEERDLIIDELYLTIDQIYNMRATGGPMFESNFRGMLKLLMGDRPRPDFVPTLLEFTLCYQNKKFRHWLRRSVEDTQTHDFLNELEDTGGEGSINNLSPYVTSKLSRFINDTTLQQIIGQEQSAFNFDEIMNSGKIFLANLGKGRFGSVVSALLANQLVTRFKLAAMKRGEMSREQRRDFFLYVDEAHNLPAENFMELLSEARKYRMGLVLATQYAAQLGETGNGKKNDLLAAILGNVGTIMVLRLGLEDAVRLAPVLQPCFSSLDISSLPNWQGYARMQTGHDSIPPFSFRTCRDDIPFNRELAEKIRTLSRLKYGRDTRLVGNEIMLRRTAWQQTDGHDSDH